MKLKGIILPFAAVAIAAATAQAKPLKVYILAGQSNMQGHAAHQMLAGMAAQGQETIQFVPLK